MQPVPIRRTCNMFVVTTHLQICYNNNSHSISRLVCQVRRSITVSRYCMLLFVSYNCYWHFHKNANSKYFKIMNTFLFRFPIIMKELNMVIMCYTDPLIKRNIILLKPNDCWKFCLHKYSLTLVSLKIILFLYLLYKYDGYFSSTVLTTIHHFNFKLITDKNAQHRKVLEQIKFFCFKSRSFNTSRRTFHSVAHFGNKIYSKAFWAVLRHQTTTVWYSECF